MSAMKVCNGCGTAVAKPVTCVSCNSVLHPGPVCLSRTGYSHTDGAFINWKGSFTPSSTGNTARYFKNTQRSTATSDNSSLRTLISECLEEQLDMHFLRLSSMLKEELATEFSVLDNKLDILSERVAILEAHRDEVISVSSSSLASLDLRISAIEAARSESAPLSSTASCDIDNLLREADDKRKRACNIILSGIAEDSSNLAASSALHQVGSSLQDKVRGILGSISDNFKIQFARRLDNSNQADAG